METKTSQAINLFSNGYVTRALRIFKTFKIGFTKEEKEKIEIAYECMTGRESFYLSLQVDTSNIKEQAIQLIKEKYNLA